MKILVYENRKSDPVYFDASTPVKELWAYSTVFNILNEWDCYEDLIQYTANHPKDYRTIQKQLYEKAKAGDGKAAKELITRRSKSNFEYEDVRIATVTIPTNEQMSSTFFECF